MPLDGSTHDLNRFPAQIRETNWPSVGNPDAIATLVRKRLAESDATLAEHEHLAGTLFEQGDLTASYDIFARTAEMRRRVHGERHPETLRALRNLEGVRRALAEATGQGPVPDHAPPRPDTPAAVPRNVDHELLGEIRSLRARGDRIGVLRLYERLIEVRRVALGDEHALTLSAMNDLAIEHIGFDDFSAARLLFQHVLDVHRRALGEDHQETVTDMNNVAVTLFEEGDYTRARALLEVALERSRRVLGETHPETVRTFDNLSETIAMQRLEGRPQAPRSDEAVEHERATRCRSWPLVT